MSSPKYLCQLLRPFLFFPAWEVGTHGDESQLLIQCSGHICLKSHDRKLLLILINGVLHSPLKSDQDGSWFFTVWAKHFMGLLYGLRVFLYRSVFGFFVWVGFYFLTLSVEQNSSWNFSSKQRVCLSFLISFQVEIYSLTLKWEILALWPLWFSGLLLQRIPRANSSAA